MISRKSALLLFVLASVPCLARRPEFEVATVKIAHPEGDRIDMNLGTIRHEHLTLTNVTLSDCIKFAWTLASDAQLAGPDWIKSKEYLYDVVAEATLGTPREQELIMLENLLAERMALRFHLEQRQASYLPLVQGKDGAKLQLAVPDTTTSNGQGLIGRIAGPRMAISTLALLLSRSEHETVIDKTGLTGFYGVKLERTPDDPRMAAMSVTADGPSLFTAIQQQLGLMLVPRKGPIDVLVIDSASKTLAVN
jgi:uncharacterized protein (TIGR03435 family)